MIESHTQAITPIYGLRKYKETLLYETSTLEQRENMNHIESKFRLENPNPVYQRANARVWIDTIINGKSMMSQVWYSGPKDIAEKIFSGELTIDHNCEVVPASPEPEPSLFIETVGDLVQRLSAFDQKSPCMILDGNNGGGSPRTINLGPVSHTITQSEADDAADCEGKVGETVVVIGFGCY